MVLSVVRFVCVTMQKPGRVARNLRNDSLSSSGYIDETMHITEKFVSYDSL